MTTTTTITRNATTTTTTTTTTAYDRGSSDVALLAETIGANFDRTVATHGHREALVEYDSARRWTYAQLRADVDELAHGLIRLGIEKGDRVGIWAPNCAEWTQLQ